jgi:hypothetical protein
MGLYWPLLLVALFYMGASIAAGMMDRREEHERADRVRDVAFGVGLAAAAYTVVLTIMVAIDTPDRFTDMVTITFVIGVFFAALVFILFLIGQLVSLVGRRRTAR